MVSEWPTPGNTREFGNGGGNLIDKSTRHVSICLTIKESPETAKHLTFHARNLSRLRGREDCRAGYLMTPGNASLEVLEIFFVRNCFITALHQNRPCLWPLVLGRRWVRYCRSPSCKFELQNTKLQFPRLLVAWEWHFPRWSVPSDGIRVPCRGYFTFYRLFEVVWIIYRQTVQTFNDVCGGECSSYLEFVARNSIIFAPIWISISSLY